MLDIITTILNVRALEDGEVSFRKQRCHTTKIIENVVNAYIPAASEKNIGIVFSTGDALPDAWADSGATHQIVDHLVSNAVKYTPHEGSVTIRQSLSEDSMVVEVMDTGPGLSKEDQSKLWKKFARLTPKPTGDEKTNGLGLWIVKHLAEEMGGSAFCRSAPGQGSIFGVTLPLWDDQEDCGGKDSDPETSKRSTAESALDRLIGKDPAATGKPYAGGERVALPG
jgi:signal transduction histidine kinase